MNEDELHQEYFEWMCKLVNKPNSRLSYSKLFRHLDNTKFRYDEVPLDSNRAADGVDLRYRFAYDKGYSNAMIASLLDIRECSVFEMIVALALRCDEHIMYDDEVGDQTYRWFWEMMSSLGLNGITNSRYREHMVTDILDRFMDRKYDKFGRGGLFTVKNPPHDMRVVEIWYQMCYRLNEIE